MELLREIWPGLATAVVLLFVLALLTPVKERLGFHSTRVLAPSGLVFRVETDPAEATAPWDNFAHHYFFPKGSSPPPPPDRIEDWWKWAHNAGGMDAVSSGVEITIQALADAAVVIDPPQVEWQQSIAPDGHIRTQGGFGGGSVTPRHFIVRLKDGTASVLYAASSEAPEEHRSASFKMSKGDTERIVISVWVDSGLCEWTLHIPYTVNGRQKRYLVKGPEGKFGTVGSDNQDMLLWHGGRWAKAWSPDDSTL